MMHIDIAFSSELLPYVTLLLLSACAPQRLFLRLIAPSHKGARVPRKRLTPASESATSRKRVPPTPSQTHRPP